MNPRLDRRALLASCGLAALGLGVGALSGCAAKSEEKALRVSVTGKGDSDYRLLFRTAGIKPDFPINYSEFQSGHQVVEALNGGSLDFGGMSEIPPVFAAASTVQSFRQIGVLHGDVNNQVVLVPKGSKLATLADLKGKRVGYVRATTGQYFLIRMLESVGLTWDDITPVAMTVADGGAAFSRGALDAWAIYGFPIQRAIATEGARILRTAYGFLSGNYVVSVHKDVLTDPVRSDWTRKYLALLKQGFRWAAAHEEQWAQIVAAEIGVPIDYVRAQFRARSARYALRPVSDEAIRSQQQVADVFSAAHLIPRRVDVRPLWDTRFNSDITKES
ncbi:MAG TPA: ABC transporter substrate-binding protein [Sphingobium sp.]|uniref:ABC transporter substrate-binding protein n=1 Tax=Sphingobium sp. TaxID=1912891 RepID=UPI002ED22A85